MDRRHILGQRLMIASYLALVAGLTSPAIARGATCTWNGSVPGNNNWNTAANWSTNKVPGSADIALFDGTATADCVVNGNVSVAGLTVAATFPGTITQSAGNTITIGSTGLSMAGGTFAGSDATITINGPYSQSGGVFTSTSGNMNILRNFTISGGTFNHNNGTVTHTSYDKSMSIGSAVLKNLVIATGGNSLTTSGTVTIAGDLTINSVNYMNGGTMAVAGNVVSNDNNLIGYPGTVILFNGTGNQTLTAGVSGALVPSVEINKPSGTLTLVGSVGIFNNWTHTAGNVDCGADVLRFVGYDKTIVPGTMSYGSVTYDTGGNSITTNGTMTVNGTFTIASVNYMNNGTIAAKGNVVTKDNALIGYPATVVQIDGTGNQTLSANGGYNLLPSLTINKSSGKLTMTDSIGVFNNFTYTAGDVDASNCTVKFVGFDKTITSTAGMVFSNVFVDTGGNSVTISGALKVSGNFTLNSVNYFQAASSGTNGTIFVGGNLTSNDTTVNSWYGVPIVLDGSGDQLLDTSAGTGVFPSHITINKVRCTGGEVKLASNLALNQSSQKLTIVSGTLNCQGFNLTVNGSSGKLIIQKGGILKLDAGAVITTKMYYPELQCGSMVQINGGSTFSFPSNTTAQISGTGSNTNWTTTGTCVAADTPSSCSTTDKKKIIQWTEVRNAAQ